jgi:hypothetical protein
MRCHICTKTVDVSGSLALVVCGECVSIARIALAKDADIIQRELRHTDPETGEVDMEALWDEVEREERDAMRLDEDPWRIAGEQFDDRLAMYMNEY